MNLQQVLMTRFLIKGVYDLLSLFLHLKSNTSVMCVQSDDNWTMISLLEVLCVSSMSSLVHVMYLPVDLRTSKQVYY